MDNNKAEELVKSVGRSHMLLFSNWNELEGRRCTIETSLFKTRTIGELMLVVESIKLLKDDLSTTCKAFYLWKRQYSELVKLYEKGDKRLTALEMLSWVSSRGAAESYLKMIKSLDSILNEIYKVPFRFR